MEATPEDKVYVAVPAEPKAGRSTLSWALNNLCGGGATTIVVTHVHVPPQMISVMGAKFHASKLNPEQVSLFRMMEREKANKLLDDFARQCLKMKVKCEKLVFEKEDVTSGLVELIGLHGITKLVISAAAERQYSRTLDRPMSKMATAIMERADPSCKIWFVCKEQLICTRDTEVEIAPAVTAPLLPDCVQEALQLPTQQEEDELELGFYDQVKEACKAAENLMERALKESYRRQKADQEMASSLQRAKEYEELYLEEVSKRKELEEALERANREIAQLREANDLPKKQQNATIEEFQEAVTTKLTMEQCVFIVANARGSYGEAREMVEPRTECVQAILDHGNGATELEALLKQRKLTVLSPSSVIPSALDEGCVYSYFMCPVFQEVMSTTGKSIYHDKITPTG